MVFTESKMNKFFIDDEFDVEHEVYTTHGVRNVVKEFYDYEGIISREDEEPENSSYQELVKLFSVDGRQDSETGYYVDTVINQWMDSNGTFYWDEIAEEYLAKRAVYEKMKSSMNEDMAKKIMGQVLTPEQIETFEM